MRNVIARLIIISYVFVFWAGVGKLKPTIFTLNNRKYLLANRIVFTSNELIEAGSITNGAI
jgi:hypothetical protein